MSLKSSKNILIVLVLILFSTNICAQNDNNESVDKLVDEICEKVNLPDYKDLGDSVLLVRIAEENISPFLLKFSVEKSDSLFQLILVRLDRNCTEINIGNQIFDMRD